MASGFTRRVGRFTAGTLLSRLLGLVREQVFAYLFGVGMATDAFNIAFRIPNFFRDLLAENAFSAAFVPEVVDGLARKKREEVWRFASNVFNVMLLGVAVLVALMIVFAPQVTRVVAWGFRADPARLALTTDLSRIMMPFLLFVALGAWAMGMLNSLNCFFVPAVAPGVFNLFSIAIPIVLYSWLKARGIEPITGMAWGVTVGALFQFLVQLPQLFRQGFKYRPTVALRDPELRQVLFVRLPFRALGLATWQVNFLVSTFLVAFLVPGSVTYLNYAYRIMHLPAGLFGVAIGSVALVQLSARMAGDGLSGAKDQMRHGLQLVMVLMFPLALLMIALAQPVVRVIYQHGPRFLPEHTLATSRALALYSLGVWAPAAARCVASGFYALKNTRTPALTGLVAVALNIGLNLVGMHVLPEPYRYLSFAFNTALAQMVDFTLLYFLFRRKAGPLGGRALLGLGLKSLGFGLVAAGSAFGLYRLLAGHVPQTLPVVLGEVLACGGIGLVLYYLLARAFRVTETVTAVHELLRPLLRRRLDRPGDAG
jgi:putative peptidoglycan lipid II flippase